MTNEELQLAKDDGAVTAKELHLWYMGFERGKFEVLTGFMAARRKDKTERETIPDHINDAISEGVKNEKSV